MDYNGGLGFSGGPHLMNKHLLSTHVPSSVVSQSKLLSDRTHSSLGMADKQKITMWCDKLIR